MSHRTPDYSGKKILTVLAHPDDETFGMGGMLALYASRGADVRLVCATRGELGDIDPEYTETIRSAACLRTQELRCAADVLGLSELYFLNYRDSGMPGAEANNHPKALAAQPLEKVAAEVAHLIREVRPEVVVTFDPIGGYRHPDHIAIQKATVRAFDLAADPDFQDPEDLPAFRPDRLYFDTIDRRFLKVMVWVLRLIGQDPHKFGKNNDIDLVSLTDVDFPTDVKIDYRPVEDIRKRATACHASQGGQEMNRGFRGFVTRLFGGHTDNFMQAYPKPPVDHPIKRDFFE